MYVVLRFKTHIIQFLFNFIVLFILLNNKKKKLKLKIKRKSHTVKELPQYAYMKIVYRCTYLESNSVLCPHENFLILEF